MQIKKLFGPLLAGLVLLPLAPGIATASTLQWRPCKEIAHRWSPGDDRTECAMVTVPVDYAKPDGRSFGIAISRIKASGRRDGVVLFNPGGPGGSGMNMPARCCGRRPPASACTTTSSVSRPAGSPTARR